MKLSPKVESVLLDSKRSSVHEWSLELDRNIIAPPTLAEDGTLYVPTDRAILALDSETSEIKWQKELKGLAMAASPVVSDDTLYLTGGKDMPLLALDRDSGEEKWRKTPDELKAPPIPAWSALTKDGLAIAGSWPGSMHEIGTDGGEKWKHELGQGVGARGAVVTTTDGTVYQVDNRITAVKNGTFLWSRRFPSGGARKAGTKVTVTPDNALLYTTGDGRLRKVNDQGNVEWEWSAEGGQRLDQMSLADREKLHPTGGFPKSSFKLNSTPVFSPDGHRIYVGGWDGTLYALDSNGNEHWRKDMPFPVAHSGIKVGDDGTLYVVGDQEGSVQALKPDGSLLWSYTSDERNTPSNVSVLEDRVILATMSGTLHSLSSLGLMKALENAEDPEKDLTKIELGDGFITIGDFDLEIR